MLLATYQPISPCDDWRNPQYDCFREKLGGEYPVFCFPARTADEFRFRSLLAAPCKPERLIVFDTDDYVRFDAVVWNNILTLPRDDDFAERFENMFEDVDERFSEYAVSDDKLVDPILSVDLKRLIDDEEIACKQEHDGVTGTVNDALEEIRNKARTMVAVTIMNDCAHMVGRNDVEAIIYQTAFVMYLAGAMWCAGLGSPCTPFELIPLMPNADNVSAADAWMRFNELRAKVFDSAGGSSRNAIGSIRSSLSRSIRNKIWIKQNPGGFTGVFLRC